MDENQGRASNSGDAATPAVRVEAYAGYRAEESPRRFFIGKREVGVVNPTGKEADVTVTISSPDLANVLDGSLAPLQAYLTGRIQAHGDVRKLMFFDKLSKRGHKPGSMFNV